MNKIFISTIVIFIFSISLNAQILPSYVSTNGLVGWWPFSGDANDLSGQNNNGQVKGAILVNDRNGAKNSAYDFDGIDDYISTNKWLSGKKNNYTISVWIYLDSQSVNPTDKSIILHRADWGDKAIFWSNTPRSVVVSDRNGTPVTGISNIILKRNTWQHLVMVSTSSTISIYINNSLSNSIQRTTSSNWDSLYRGSYFGGDGFDTWQGFFKGKLDEIGIWSRSLTLPEIKNLFESCLPSITKNPNTTTVNIGKNAQFNVSTSNQNAKFQWQTDLGVGFQNLTNSGQYSGVNNDTLTISNTTLSNNNQKFICIVSYVNCIDTSKVGILFISQLGVNENKSNKVSIYPNPSNDELLVKIDKNSIGNSFTLSNAYGQIVFSGLLLNECSQITIKDFQSGIYYLKIGIQNQQIFKVTKL